MEYKQDKNCVIVHIFKSKKDPSQGRAWENPMKDHRDWKSCKRRQLDQ